MRWLLGSALIMVGVTAPSVPAWAERTENLCASLAEDMEQAEGIPPGLVQAVALAESGRWSRATGRTRAWPWTITSGPDSYYLPSKEAALDKVRELRSAGRTNIDVGCMQVNLGYHGHAFTSLDEALDPATNVAYGARFLKRLRVRTRSWARATARYHSGDPERGAAYRTKVFRLWGKVRRGEIDSRVASDVPVLRGDSAPEAEPGRGGESAPAGGMRLTSPVFASPSPVAVLRGQ